MNTFTYSLEELDQAAAWVIQKAKEQPIWLFQGEMGAGKTTLIRSLAKAFQVEDSVSSPTFGIVNEYHTKTGEPIYHFDFYRLEDPAEALDIGIEEYFYSGNRCWIEWAEKISEYLPEEFVLLKISSLSPQSRQITLLFSQDAQ
ncbi:tRNA (adenosine(37)-N6)-threonylcarbamoyltransferase complex ATPase subunit type 1 TsaE [Algoriphagus sanaruensis]|uniref:tRNA threonylcarbamoyladenosine biosynthesis protein TsaE n=1 Tax=Algoriphagus sanaruensis TaxID=1727163 RepID=A0A142EMM7_9BACT|nr:tRNA (adenosine(37)-N6)-threonylcarbamoyltransferase complex ATPase subunit type 1 TsaE [Algoriphagus sanaruensis]AMQ56382.1 tRNA threonylcarbamoyladenosine biosynthesisprotein TsaE [Algoriphagus sanaruensis]